MVNFSSDLSVLCPSSCASCLCEDAGNTLTLTGRGCGAEAICNLLFSAMEPVPTHHTWQVGITDQERGCSDSNAKNGDPGTEDTKQEPNTPSSHLLRENGLIFPTDNHVFVCKNIWVSDTLQNIFLCKDHYKDKGCKAKFRDHSELSDLAKAVKYWNSCILVNFCQPQDRNSKGGKCLWVREHSKPWLTLPGAVSSEQGSSSAPGHSVLFLLTIFREGSSKTTLGIQTQQFLL